MTATPIVTGETVLPEGAGVKGAAMALRASLDPHICAFSKVKRLLLTELLNRIAP